MKTELGMKKIRLDQEINYEWKAAVKCVSVKSEGGAGAGAVCEPGLFLCSSTAELPLGAGPGFGKGDGAQL